MDPSFYTGLCSWDDDASAVGGVFSTAADHPGGKHDDAAISSSVCTNPPYPNFAVGAPTSCGPIPNFAVDTLDTADAGLIVDGDSAPACSPFSVKSCFSRTGLAASPTPSTNATGDPTWRRLAGALLCDPDLGIRPGYAAAWSRPAASDSSSSRVARRVFTSNARLTDDRQHAAAWPRPPEPGSSNASWRRHCLCGPSDHPSTSFGSAPG